jgi:ferredoxin
MTHVITSLCLRDGGCVSVCPVECIVPGKPEDQWTWYYIDPDTCIDCGACIPECPYSAIFPEDEVPTAYKAKGGELQSQPAGTPGFDQVFDGKNHEGAAVHIGSVKKLNAGESVDLSNATAVNAAFFKSGPGYSAIN